MNLPSAEQTDERLRKLATHEGTLVAADYRRLLLSGCALLDVRAPAEFDRGAFPTSVNLPLMSDEERHLVGLRYKTDGQESAIALGAKLITPAIQADIVNKWSAFFRSHPDARLYCFRGGLRSRIAQQWLADAGLQVPRVDGGYKALRTFLINEMQRLCASLRFTIIGGRTGNGKTLLLKQLGAKVDLEGLANHRGSSFGKMPDGHQPRNIDFENALSIALMHLEEQSCKHVYLEDEARLIGRVCLPDALRAVMLAAPIYILECDMSERIENCFDDYVTDLLSRYQQHLGEPAGFDAFADHHRQSLSRIKKRFGSENYQRSLTLLNTALHIHRQNGDTTAYRDFIELLLREYYDPMYDYQLAQKAGRIVFRGTREQIVQRAGSPAASQVSSQTS